MNSTAFIGDVNGDISSLELLVDFLITRVDKLVFLGDVIGSSRTSRLVVDLLIGLERAFPQTVFVQGNHEANLIEFIHNGRFEKYLMKSGLAVLQSYLGTAYGDVVDAFRSEFPNSHMQFLQRMPLFIDEPGFFASHAGLDPRLPEERNPRVVRDGKYALELDAEVSFGRPVVFGHFVQKSGMPLIRNDRYLLDTGCGSNKGPLTALVLPTYEFFQARSGRVDKLR